MLAFWTEAAAFLLRWLHVVAAIAWIGESFYFVALDRGLKPPKQGAQGLFGESWSVHGGGFYLKQKFLPAPVELPADMKEFFDVKPAPQKYNVAVLVTAGAEAPALRAPMSPAQLKALIEKSGRRAAAIESAFRDALGSATAP